MNIGRRAFLYVIRKKEKSLTLFLLLLLISSFVMVGFSIVSGTHTAAKDLRETVGASLRMRGMVTGLADDKSSSSYGVTGIPITDMQINQILKIGGFKTHNTIQSVNATSDDYFYLSGAPYGLFSANRDTQWNTEFINKLYQLAQGRHIGVNDKNTAIISRELADANELHIGDAIRLKAISDEANGMDTSVTIIGFYDVDQQQEPSRDTIFIDRYTFSQLCGDRQLEYDTVTFYTTDPAELPAIMQQVKALNEINWEQYTLAVQNEEYDSIALQLMSMEKLMAILITAVAFVSIIILTLTLTMRVHGRIYEIGILLSIGTSKREIIGQLLIETLMLALLAFILSYPVGTLAAGRIEKNILRTVTDVNIALPFLEVMLIYFLEMVTITATVLVASLSVMRFKPKEILSKMS